LFDETKSQILGSRFSFPKEHTKYIIQYVIFNRKKNNTRQSDFELPDLMFVAGLHTSEERSVLVVVNVDNIAESTGSIHEGQVNDRSSQSRINKLMRLCHI
jgi:hypothetical protein